MDRPRARRLPEPDQGSPEGKFHYKRLKPVRCTSAAATEQRGARCQAGRSRLRDEDTGKAAPGLTVEAWDTGHLFGQPLSTDTSNADGAFRSR